MICPILGVKSTRLEIWFVDDRMDGHKVITRFWRCKRCGRIHGEMPIRPDTLKSTVGKAAHGR